MPVSCNLTKENVIKKAVIMVNKNGWDSLTARDLAKALKISTKPLYRIYSNMDEIKNDLYKEIYKQYDEFITSRVDNKKALVTLCVAYVEFAKWNQGAIINLVNKQGYTFEEAKDLFMHIWLYANGLATLIATNKIFIEDKEIIVRIVKIFKTLEK